MLELCSDMSMRCSNQVQCIQTVEVEKGCARNFYRRTLAHVRCHRCSSLQYESLQLSLMRLHARAISKLKLRATSSLQQGASVSKYRWYLCSICAKLYPSTDLSLNSPPLST